MGDAEPRGSRRDMGKAALTPLANIVSVLLTMGTLAVATHKAAPGVIAGFMAGSSAVAVAAVVAGGTTLAYATGDAETRGAVKYIRYRMIVPLMGLSSLAAALVYTQTSHLSFTPVILGGLTVVFNNLAELESAKLQRGLRTQVLLYGTMASRSCGLLAVLLGVNFAAAMSVAALLNLVILTAGNLRTPDRTPTPSLRRAIALAYRWELLSLTGLDVLVTRAAFLMLPFMPGLSHSDGDAFAALLSATQSGHAILTTGLYTLMAHRSANAGPAPEWMRRFTRLVIAVAVLVVPIGAVAGPLVLAILGLNTGRWWLFLMLAATPFVCLNRSRQYELTSDKHLRQAVIVIGYVAAITVTWVIVALWASRPDFLAATALVAEGLGAIVLTIHSRMSPAWALSHRMS